MDVVPITQLRTAAWNPREITASSFKTLMRSLERDPGLLWSRPILATKDGVIYAGNRRYDAAVQLGESWRRRHFGIDGVPAILEDLTPDQARERMIRDNSQWGEWVEQDLAEMLCGLEAQGVPLDILGIERDQIERLLALVSQDAPADDDAFDPTPPTVPETRTGDLMLLGPHRLVCGDSRDGLTWELLMESGSEAGRIADAVWTDPPYGVDLQLRHGDARRMDPDKSRRLDPEPAFAGDRPEEVAPLLAAVLPNCDRWLKPGAPFYIAGPNGRMAAVFIEEIARVGWYLSQTLVWVKNAFVPGRADYHYQHEAIFYGWKPGEAHIWLQAPDQPTVFDDEPDLAKLARHELVALVKELHSARITDVLREDKTRHNDLHPTMKPTSLIRGMLANSTRRDDLVLDPFAGSGSTIVAAHLMGRRVAAIELEPRFCDVVVRRWLELHPANQAHRVRQGRVDEVRADA